MQTIRDFGWPISLTDLALGMMKERSALVPIYFSGFEEGYEARPYAGLYNPDLSGNLSPLISALEAPDVEELSRCSNVDTFPLSVGSSAELERDLNQLNEECLSRDHSRIRGCLDKLSWALLDKRLENIPKSTLSQVAKLVATHNEHASEQHRRITDLIVRRSEDQ